MSKNLIIAQIDGLDKLLKKLDSVANETEYTKALEKCCRVVQTTAKEEHVPVATGTLKRSITHEIRREGQNINGYVGTNVEYAVYQEFGTGKFAENGNGRETPWAYADAKTGETIWTVGNKPHPFLRPALKENEKKCKEIIKTAIENAVQNKGGR